MRRASSTLFFSPVFWFWSLLFAIMLTLGGFGLAQILLPKPLNFFHTGYMSLAIPQEWRCVREDTAYFCGRNLAPVSEASRNAVVIFSAKVRGDHDSLEVYREHLRKQRPVDADGVEVSASIVEEVIDQQIAGRNWVVGRHLHSELPNYRTWYFATVAEDLAVLVTYSAHQSVAEDHLEDVEAVLENLTLYKPLEPG